VFHIVKKLLQLLSKMQLLFSVGRLIILTSVKDVLNQPKLCLRSCFLRFVGLFVNRNTEKLSMNFRYFFDEVGLET